MTRQTLLTCALVLSMSACRGSDEHGTSTHDRDNEAPHQGPLPSQKTNPPDRLTPLKRLSPKPPRQQGIALGLFSEDSGWSYEPLLKEIKALGATHVSLVVAYYLADIHAVEVYAHPRYTAPDAVLRRTIRQARKLGIQVLLFPILRVAYKPTPDHWRGNLAPSRPKALQQSYLKLMVRLARLAQQEHVAILSLGSEMSSLDGIENGSWFAPVAKAVRKVYHGTLTYSANWDHFQKTRLWHLVDQAGLCAYFGLTSSDRPTLRAMVEGWRQHKKDILRWAKKTQKPFIFTEVGYPSQVGAAKEPWNEGARRPLDQRQQTGAYEAFVRTWNGVSRCAGAYFWNWYGWGGPKDRSYTPRRKPASRIITWWYGGTWPVDWWVPGRSRPAGPKPRPGSLTD